MTHTPLMRRSLYFLRLGAKHLESRQRLLMMARHHHRPQNMLTSFCLNCLRNNGFVTVAPQETSNLDVSTPEVISLKEKKRKKSSNVSKTSKAKPLSAAAKLNLDYVEKQCGPRGINLTRLLPKQSLRSTTVIPTTAYLIDETEAKKISDAIKSENPDRESPVVELHPGLGLLTWELVKEIGFKYVTCLEDCTGLAENLANLYDVSVIDCSVDDLPRHHHLDKHDGGERINSILTSITTSAEDSDGSSRTDDSTKRQLYVIGALPHVSTMNFLIRCYVTKRVFFEDDLPWSGVTLFAALGAKSVHICTAQPDSGLVAYRPTSVFFQTLFKFKELGTVPGQAFIPRQGDDPVFTDGRKRRRLKIEDPFSLKLMRIEINEEVQEKIGKDNLFVYWYFVRQNLYARTNRIIPELERWVPGFGVKLIKQGFNIYSQFGALKPDQILDLYLQFVSWPGFAESSFLSAVEKFQTRLELSEEDGDNK